MKLIRRIRVTQAGTDVVIQESVIEKSHKEKVVEVNQWSLPVRVFLAITLREGGEK